MHIAAYAHTINFTFTSLLGLLPLGSGFYRYYVSALGNRYILTISDWSKWAEAIATPDKTVNQTVKFLFKVQTFKYVYQCMILLKF